MTAGVAIVVFVLLGLNVFLYVSVRSNLEHNLDEVLDSRVQLVRAQAVGSTPEALASMLTQLGIRARIEASDGRIYTAAPPSPVIGGNNLPPAGADFGAKPVSRSTPIPGIGTVTVFARRTGIDQTLQRLLVFQAVGTAAAAGIAATLLARVARLTLRPVDEMAAMTRRVAGGQRGVRLSPDRPQTTIGQLARSYDEMLERLEAAVDEARAAQAQSERLHQRTQKIIATATDAFVSLDAAGRVVEWNPRAEAMFGWSRDEVLLRPLRAIIFPEGASSEGGFDDLLGTRGGGAFERRLELPARHRDGRVFPVEVTAWKADDPESAVNAFIRDITERMTAEEATARLAAIVDTAQDAIVSESLDGTILTWNRAAEQMYAYPAAEAVGRSSTMLLPPERQEEHGRFLDEVRQGRPVNGWETVRRTKNGTVIDVALSMSPILDRSGSVVGASTIARDITEQRWIATALNAALADLERALETARQSEARSRRFLADAAHQLRRPVAGIRACAETLLRGVESEERDRLLTHLVREAWRASRLLADLLKLAHLDQDPAVALVECDPEDICSGEVERIAALAPDLDIDVRANGRARGPVRLDPNAVREIVANLLDNARRHARHRVEVVLATRGELMDLRVRDDGPGVPAEARDRIFERFVSLDGKGGTGLGLPIAKALAQAHGGDLGYEDGSFVLRLPLG